MLTETVSLWQGTVNRNNRRPSLLGQIETDVVIVGAGFTGISSAYFLSKKGISAVVLEQETVGWGATGRNGGMMNTGYKPSAEGMIARWGLEDARKLDQIAIDSIHLVDELVKEHTIDCSIRHCGHIVLTKNPKSMNRLRNEVGAMQKYFGREVRIVEGNELQNEIGSNYYKLGMVDSQSYGFHPLNYALGLADAAESLGAKFYEKSKVTSIKRTGETVTVLTDKGVVKAKEVIVATDGYSSRISKELDQGVIPVASYVIATEPLDEDLIKRLIPNNRMLFDTTKMTNYFRITPDSRMLYGGSGVRHDRGHKYFPELHQKMLMVFPQLAPYKIDYRWSGLIGVTKDFFPVIGKMEDGSYFATGYCGHGGSQSTLLGKILADCIAKEQDRIEYFEKNALKPFPFSSQKGMLINLANIYYRWLDRNG
ncbi:NAD(P)/FAD-dependent oxidoreductase [Brevibacillus ginsengisoli]|uniref:NAD(P)/FAD-dependent oxidoreductase n=1 Tax=Brevibacillus ginsengisoli TaxID=363854 RepID=UPI003CF4778D